MNETVTMVTCRVLIRTAKWVLYIVALGIGLSWNSSRPSVVHASSGYTRPMCYDSKGLAYSEGAIIGKGSERKQCMPIKVDWIQPPVE